MVASDILLRHTNKEGTAYVHAHRVWDRDLFLLTQSTAAVKEGGKVEVLTEAEFEKERR